jgi:transcriptional regulator with XRE-family HTH domain
VAGGITKERNATREERPPPSAVDTAGRPAAAKIKGSGTIGRGDEIFGRLIAVRRAALGLSQEDLAARIETSQARVAGIEGGRPPNLETVERLAAALAAEPRTGPARRYLAGRWRWGGLAIAILVPTLVIVSGRGGESGKSDGGALSQRPPGAESITPAAPAPVVRVQGKPRTEIQKETQAHKSKAQKTRGAAGRHEQSPAAGKEPPGSAPETLKPTSPAPPPSGIVSPQPSGSGSPSAPLKPTGKPAGTPGNGPGGGGSGGDNGTAGGNGPDGTGPPGQLR